MVGKATIHHGFPKIRKNTNSNGGFLPYKYKVGRDNVGWWSLCRNLFDAIKTWFSYL